MNDGSERVARTGVEGLDRAGRRPTESGTGAPALALSLLVGCVVAVVAGDLRLVPPAADLTEGAVVAVRLAGVLALTLGVALLWRRPWVTSDVRRPLAPRMSAVRRAAVIVGLLTVTALLANPIRLRGPALGAGPALGVPDFGFGSERADGPPSRDVGGSSVIRGRALRSAEATDQVVRLDDEVAASPTAERLRRLLGPLLLLLTGLVLLRIVVRSQRAGDATELGRSPEEADAGVERPRRTAVGFVGPSGPFDDDPHGRIVSAYHRLLVELDRAGRGRRREEGPHEHVDRATASESGAAPLRQLAGLYVLAEFGGTELSDLHGGAAQRALADGLRWLARRGGTSK